MEIAGALFIAGLLLWWIIRSDLKQMAFQERMRAENAKRDAAYEADRRDAEAIRRSGKAYAARRDDHLRHCQSQLRKLQDERGLLSVKAVSDLFEWGPYEGHRGRVEYNNYETISRGDEIYAAGNEEHGHPFPKEVSEGFYRASDLVEWIEERLHENSRNDDWLRE